MEEARTGGDCQGVEDGAAVERGDNAVGEVGVETGAGVLLGDAVVVLQGDVGLTYDLDGRKCLSVGF